MKHNHTQKILSLLLAALMTLPLAACSDSPETPDTTEPAASSEIDTTTAVPETTIPPELVDELPETSEYDGQKFVVLSHDHDASSVAWQVVDIWAEAENGERINDAVIERNRKIDERYGVVVEQDLQAAPHTMAQTAISAGTTSFSLIQTTIQNQSALAINGYLLNMNKLQYLNFEKGWWDRTANESLCVADKMYYAIGDSQLNAKKATWVVLFNKKLTTDANLEDLYAVVRDGKWTMDYLKQNVQKIQNDVNGDGTMRWGEDVFGLGLQDEVVLPLLLGTGGNVVTFNKDGSYEYTLGSSNNMDALERIWNFLNTDNTGVLNANNYSMTNLWIEFRNQFIADQIGFYMGHLGTVTLVGPQMQSDFGILPFPKVFEDQADYYSTFQYNNAHAVSVPKSTEDLAYTALITEAYQMYAHDTILPAYYDFTLTLRSARDNESGEMLDIIFANRNLDVALAYNSMTSIQALLESAGKTASFTFASTEAKGRTKLETNINKVIEKIIELDL